MIGNLKSINSRLLKRQCVECGYDGPQLKNGMTHRCVRCGCDFRDRPARSYAEMEGLLDLPLIRTRPRPKNRRAVRQGEQLVYRWLAMLFTSMLLVIGIVYLTAALMPAPK